MRPAEIPANKHRSDFRAILAQVIGCVFSGASIEAMARRSHFAALGCALAGAGAAARPPFAILGCAALAGAGAAAAAYAMWTRKKDASVIRVQLSPIMIAFLLGPMVILDISMVMLEFHIN